LKIKQFLFNIQGYIKNLMLSEQDLKKTFKLVVEEANIVAVTFSELLSEDDSNQQARIVVGSVEEVFNKNPKLEFGLLVDLTPLKVQPSFLTNDSRAIYEEFAQNKQLRKVAIVGANLFYKVATNFLMSASRRGRGIKWFSTKEEAVTWLREQ
jgi:hypothetical protein